MGVSLQGRLVLALDNTAAITIAHDVGVSGRTKHFDRAIHYLRDLTQLRRILPIFVSTDRQRADRIYQIFGQIYICKMDASRYSLTGSRDLQGGVAYLMSERACTISRVHALRSVPVLYRYSCVPVDLPVQVLAMCFVGPERCARSSVFCVS